MQLSFDVEYYSYFPNGNELIVFGGKNAKSGYSENIYSMDLINKKVTKIKYKGSSSLPVTDCIIHIIDKLLFLFGGTLSNHMPNNKIWVFNLEEKMWMNVGVIPPHIRLSGLSIFHYNEHFYFFYSNKIPSLYWNEVSIWNSKTYAWSTVVTNTGPVPLSYYSLNLYTSTNPPRVFLFGGNQPNTVCINQLWTFNLGKSSSPFSF